MKTMGNANMLTLPAYERKIQANSIESLATPEKLEVPQNLSEELTSEDMDDPFEDIESFLAQAKEKVHEFTEEELNEMSEADVKKSIMDERGGYCERVEKIPEKIYAEKNPKSKMAVAGATYQKGPPIFSKGNSKKALMKQDGGYEQWNDEDSQMSHFSAMLRGNSNSSINKDNMSMDESQPGAFRANGINTVLETQEEEDAYFKNLEHSDPFCLNSPVEAVKVDVEEEESSNAERIREQILQQSVEAMAVQVMPEEEEEKRAVMCKVRVIILSFVLAITGVVVALVLVGTGKEIEAFPSNNNPSAFGSVWISYGQRLLADKGASEYGECVALNGEGNILAVGAYEAEEGFGTVRVMTYMATVGWSHLGNTIKGKRINQKFGSTVQLSRDGKNLLVGAIGSSTFGTGEYGHVSAYEYDNETFKWIQIGEIIEGEYKGDRFGISLSMSSNGMSFIIGADNDRHDDNEKVRDGYVRVYELSNKKWEQKGRTIHGSDGSWTAYAVAMSGDGQTICVGDRQFMISKKNRPGRTRCFRWWEPDRDWRSLGSDIIGTEHYGQEGYSIALNEPGTIVSSSQRGSTSSGFVRVFEWIDGNWMQKGETMSGKHKDDQFGFKVSLNRPGDVMAITGRKFNSPIKNNTGVVRASRWVNDKWESLGGDIYGYEADDHFGESVALSDNGKFLLASANWGTVEYANAFRLV
eukprot:CAMPEP_0194136272 /NCGR_PEP_ID=MMETSP0152-20130528/6301_1 /TAXON_ID=1049557 /ORGANISM="Thalassiothrix antarctica, Strain L6-D1" /LENGTH=696 /DNA_ID=CAMNT_0038832863 /DNA_START=192 /DNA_END=2282 /DNA_ORIENTATION=+